MKERNLKFVIVDVGTTIFGLLGSAVLTNIFAPYFLEGVKLERGYDATGGEIFFVAIIFVLVAGGMKLVLQHVLDGGRIYE